MNPIQVNTGAPRFEYQLSAEGRSFRRFRQHLDRCATMRKFMNGLSETQLASMRQTALNCPEFTDSETQADSIVYTDTVAAYFLALPNDQTEIGQREVYEQLLRGVIYPSARPTTSQLNGITI